MTTWDDLAATALLGTRRRTADVGALPGPLGEAAAALDASDPAATLLDAAALAVPYRRAGQRVAAFGATLPEPAPPDTLPVAGAAAGARLAQLLEPPYSAARVALLREWLSLAAARGVRVPPETLPALLTVAGRGAELAREAAPVVGERGRWLARLNPYWAAVVAAAAPAAPGDDEATWRTGTPDERRAVLERLRRTDPTAGRDLLTSTWRDEKGDDREEFVDLLRTGLSAADEPFLEAALDDRRGEVRSRAASLLSALPGSAYAARMTARVRAAIRLERRLLRTRLVVTPPEHDAALGRDGIHAKPPAGTGPQAWLLRQLAQRAPLRAWEEATGLAPAQLLDTTVEGGWRPELVAGWFDAAIAQDAVAWARALVAKEGVPQSWSPAQPVVRLLPPPERAAVAAALLRAPSEGRDLALILRWCEQPWPRELVDAAFAFLAKPPGPPSATHSAVVDVLATSLPPSRAPDVAALAFAREPGEGWRTALQRVADTLSFRHDMSEELR